FELIGGHPHLTRLVYSWILAGTLRLPSDTGDVVDPHEQFGDHLRAMVNKLSAPPELVEELQRTLQNCAAAPEVVHRLPNESSLPRLSSPSAMSDASDPQLRVGGTLGLTALYVERAEDNLAYDLLAAGEFCNVLAARQMGKSSLVIRLMN